MPNDEQTQSGSNTDTSNKTDSYIEHLYDNFETNAGKLSTALKAAEDKMARDPSNPSYLAAYQAKLQEYTLFRSAESSSIKATKDIAASIIQNFR